MKELTPSQIAMAVAGHSLSGVTELRLLGLFHFEAAPAGAVDAVEPKRVPLPLAV